MRALSHILAGWLAGWLIPTSPSLLVFHPLDTGSESKKKDEEKEEEAVLCRTFYFFADSRRISCSSEVPIGVF